MSVSLYEVSVGTYLQMLPAVLGVLAKAEAFLEKEGVNPNEVLKEQLCGDMLPLEFQMRSVVHHSLGCIKGLEAGLFKPPASEPDLDYATLKGRIESAIAELKTIKPETVNAYMGKDMLFKMSAFEVPFTAEGFVLSFSLPNFYFHVTTLYGLLRKRGVDLGKRDYLGQMKIKM